MTKIENMALRLNSNPNLSTDEERLLARLSYKAGAKDMLGCVIDCLGRNGISAKCIIDEFVD